MDQEYNQEENITAKAMDQTFDPTSLFEHDKTKKLIAREEPKIAKLPQQHVRLIDTTAALFLQNLVSAVASSVEEEKECITLKDLRSTISSNESLHFLKPALADLHESKRAEPPYVQAKKKTAKPKSTAEPNQEKIKKAKSFLGKHNRDDEETVGVALHVSDEKIIAESNAGPTSEIVPDEDDYD